MKERNKFLTLIAALLVITAVYYFLTREKSKDLLLIGTVDANQVIVGARISGRIERLSVDEGMEVKAGDVIAMLDSAELEAQKQAALAVIASLHSQVSGTRSQEAAITGETSSGVATAKAQLQAVRAQLEAARADLLRLQSDDARIQSLVAAGVASRQEGDRSAQQVKAQQARVDSLRDQVRAAQAEINMAESRTHQAQAAGSAVAATRAQLENAKALLEQAETRLAYTKVVAPVDGTVSVRVAREGEVVNAGAPIVTIVQYSDTWVRAALPETYADSVAIGQKVKVRLPSGALMDGEVIFKAAESDFATQRDVSRKKRDIRTVVLKVHVDNREKRLTPGMTAEVLIPQALVEAADRQRELLDRNPEEKTR